MSASDKAHALCLVSAHSSASGNKKYDMLKKGDLIKIKRKYCWHWAVYYGRGTVIHVIVECKEEGICKAVIDFQALDEVIAGDTFKIGNKKDSKWTPLPPEEIAERAFRSRGDITYNIITDNCEHFARWCRYGVDYCNQAKILKAWLPDKYFQILLKKSYEDLTDEEKQLIKAALEKLERIEGFSFSTGVRNVPLEAVELSRFPQPATSNGDTFMERKRTPIG